MKIEQTKWTSSKGWEPRKPGDLSETAQLVLIFASTGILKANEQIIELKKIYKKAQFVGCSTAGEICGTQVSDDSLVATAVFLEHSQVHVVQTPVQDPNDSFAAGERLAQALDKKGLVHVFVLSDGLHVNGSDLVNGLTKHLSPTIAVTGGLSGDGDRFKETLVLIDKGTAHANVVAAVGLYGDRLEVGFGSQGGWDSFGPDRTVTKSKGNVLYELDGQSALDLYKKYLGEHAQGLPATGLLFPLCVKNNGDTTGVVRTILAVNESDKSMTFAGDIPEGSSAKLMKANFDRLIDGASDAARTSHDKNNKQADLAILISCVGRKLILQQRIEEEVEAVRDVQGKETVLTGFYSYGEIAPFMPNVKCELHNQTMTITTLTEK